MDSSPLPEGYLVHELSNIYSNDRGGEDLFLHSITELMHQGFINWELNRKLITLKNKSSRPEAWLMLRTRSRRHFDFVR